MAPEIISDQSFEGPPLDLWGIGVILYYLITGRHPFDTGKSLKSMKKAIVKY